MKNLLLLLCILSSSVFASNFHEHLQYLPFGNDFKSVPLANYQEALKGKKVKDMFFPAELAGNFCSYFYPQDNDCINRQIYELLNQDFFQSHLSLHGSESLQAFERRQLYLAIGSLRYALLQSLDINDYLQVYESWLQSEELIDRKVVDLSIFIFDFFSKKETDKISSLIQLARQYQTKMNFFIAIPRYGLINQDINQSLLDKMTYAIRSNEGLRNSFIGIDVVGSIFEADRFDPTNSEISLRESLNHMSKSFPLGKDNGAVRTSDLNEALNPMTVTDALLGLFEFSFQKDLQLRLHAFEAANKGPFYRGLMDALVQFEENVLDDPNRNQLVINKKKLTIRMGHSLFSSDHWNALFTKFDAINIVQEINMASSKYLFDQHANLKLGPIIKKFEERGIPYLIGSDGRGMLPRSSASEQLRALDKNCSKMIIEMVRLANQL